MIRSITTTADCTSRTRRRWFIGWALCLVAIAGYAHGQAAPNAIENGDFDRLNPYDRPVGWSLAGQGAAVVEESGNRFLRLTNTDPTGSSFAEQRLRLKPEWSQLTVSVQMRTGPLSVGSESWENARVQLQFVDDQGQRVGDWPAIPQTGQANMPWRRFEVELAVPDGATRLMVQPLLLHSTGRCDFDDITVQPIEVGRLPEGMALRWGEEPVERLTEHRGRMVINGLWRFMPARAQAQQRPIDRGWGYIQVPGSWKPASMPGLVAQGNGPVWRGFDANELARAWYRREVKVPAGWAGRAIHLDIDRVSTDALVFVNGKSCGQVHWPGGRVRIDQHTKPGQTATIDLLVVATSDTDQVEVYMGPNQVYTTDAQLQTRGVIGDVMLTSQPDGACIADVQIEPSVRRRELAVTLTLADVTQPGRADLNIELLDAQGQPAKRHQSTVTLKAKAQQQVSVRFAWVDARLWDIGQPNLYTAKIHVSQRGQVNDTVAQRFGFREFWIEGRRFFLNGTPIRFRPINMPGESWSKMAGSRPATRTLLESYLASGFNLVEQWPDDMDARGVMHFRTMICEIADEVGIGVAASLPSMKRHLAPGEAHWTRPGVQRRFEQRTRRAIDRLRHHPSALIYSFTGNAFGHAEDQNPRLIGMTRQSAGYQRELFGQAWQERMAMGDQAVSIIKRLDPTRPVLVHQGGPVGDIYALNNYLNWMPLQEREQWLGHWSTQGQMPYMAVEFGTPLHCSFMRGKAGGGWGRWTGACHSEPLMTEYCAAYLGPEAYALETDAYRQSIRDNYAPQESEKRSQPNMLYHTFWGSARLNFAPAVQKVEQLFVRNTWRSWRLSGISGGMIPWDDAHGFNHGTTVGQQMVKLPDFKPGQRGTAVRQVKARFQYPYSQQGAEILPAGRTLLEHNGPTLAFIAGSPDAPLAKDHHFVSGQRVTKQVALINDTRSALTFHWEVTIETLTDSPPAQTGQGSIAPGTEILDELHIEMPIVDAPTDGRLELKATIGDRTHADTFAFRVYPQSRHDRSRKVMVIDPAGDTRKMLGDLGVEVTDWPSDQTDLPVVIGRRSLERDASALQRLRPWVQAGGCLVVMAQHPDWIQRYWAMRVDPLIERRVFIADPQHPIVQGLDSQDLRDWNGASTLLEPKPDYLHERVRRTTYGGFPWHGWRWGGQGGVTSAAIEKPHRSGWTPILECGFDLAFSPLMELRVGRGRVLLCTLDLEDHHDQDPVARLLVNRLIDYAIQSKPDRPVDQTDYIGGAVDRQLLDMLGVEYHPARQLDPDSDVIVIGTDANIDDDRMERFVAEGGRLVVMPRSDISGPLGARFRENPTFPGGSQLDHWPELTGLTRSDIRRRVEGPAWLIDRGAQVSAEGLFGRRTIGRGVVLYCQVDPRRFDTDAQPYLRYTRWRAARAVSQVLANMGVRFTADELLFNPTDRQRLNLSLAGVWRGRLTGPLPPSRDYAENAHADGGISALAEAAVKPDHDDADWQQVKVPQQWENWGGTWQQADGEAVFRRWVDLPADAATRDMLLHLGPIDDFDQTFVNGQQVGQTDQRTPQFYAHQRVYRVPADHLKPGRNLIAVRVFDRFGGGGLVAQPQQMKLVPDRQPTSSLYLPDYRTDFDYGDDPYRYCRW